VKKASAASCWPLLSEPVVIMSSGLNPSTIGGVL
jgi:hypothetical protein